MGTGEDYEREALKDQAFLREAEFLEQERFYEEERKKQLPAVIKVVIPWTEKIRKLKNEQETIDT